jgi:DEAD/DEAH box helicase domain-containing protein
MLHEQAIYQHDGEQYQVERLDHENHKAFVTKVEPDYFTTAMTNRKVTPLDTANESRLFRGTGVLGEVSVVEKVVGFKKIKFFTHENTGYGDVRLPDIQMHTTSFWWIVPAGLCLDAGLSRGAAVDGLRGILRALETVATVALMCDPRDIGQSLEDGCLGVSDVASEASSVSPSAELTYGFDPTLFLFDNVPGGIGLAPRIHEQAPELLARVRHLLTKCGCEAGCPLCVGAVEAPPPHVPGRPPTETRKRSSLVLLERLLHDA